MIKRATAYASERKVFTRPIGSNQGVQSPLARAHMSLEAADLMRWKVTWLYEQQLPCGAEANMAKFLASEASFAAANAALDTHGGFGFAEEYDIERKFRETLVLDRTDLEQFRASVRRSARSRPPSILLIALAAKFDNRRGCRSVARAVTLWPKLT